MARTPITNGSAYKASRVAERIVKQQQLRELNAEYKLWAPSIRNNPHSAKVCGDLTPRIHQLKAEILALEDEVDVTIPANFVLEVGPKIFNQGIHRVRESVAQQLLHMMSLKQQHEDNLVKNRGRELRLGNINEHASVVPHLLLEEEEIERTRRGLP